MPTFFLLLSFSFLLFFSDTSRGRWDDIPLSTPRSLSQFGIFSTLPTLDQASLFLQKKKESSSVPLFFFFFLINLQKNEQYNKGFSKRYFHA